MDQRFLIAIFLAFTLHPANTQLGGVLKDLLIGGGAANVYVEVFKQMDNNEWIIISKQRTNERGGVSNVTTPEEFTMGAYKFVYYPEEYYAAKNLSCFYPEMEVQLEKLVANETYSIVVSMSPYGYSAYRGHGKTTPPTNKSNDILRGGIWLIILIFLLVILNASCLLK